MANGSFSSDIRVVFDPAFEAVPVVAPLNQSGMGQKSEHSSAKRVPAVNINRRLILPSRVYEVFIDLRGPYPEGRVTISDPEGVTYRNDNPGTNNSLYIVITPTSSKTYRKMKIMGYITSVRQEGAFVTYEFKHKYMPLEKSYVGSWPRCNSYDIFSRIAKETSLGFAVSENVEHVPDVRYRCCMGETVREFLERQASYGGVDEDSVLDFWIDPWNYVNLVNLSHILSKPDENIKISATVGRLQETEEMPEPNSEDVEFPRFITNMQLRDKANIVVETFRINTDNAKVYADGNSFEEYVTVPAGVNYADASETEPEKSGVTGNSLDSQNIEAFEFGRVAYLGADMEEVPALRQRRNRERLLQKLGFQTVEFEMSEPNFGLARGMQVGVFLTAQGAAKEALSDGPSEDMFVNDGLPVYDRYHSGVYYISGMTFSYSQRDDRLIQTVYGVKMGVAVPETDIAKNADGSVALSPSAYGTPSTDADSSSKLTIPSNG